MPLPIVLPEPIVQEPPVPLAARKVTDLLTALVSGVTLIPPTLVRPRWQHTPPQQPPAHADWASIGIMRRVAQGYTHQSMSFLPGTTTEALLLKRWAEFEVLASFYGPNSEDLAELFRDSLYLTTNLAPLYEWGIKLTSVNDIIAVPDLVNYQFIDHQDCRFDMVREFDRFYPMQSLQSAQGTLYADLDADDYQVLIQSEAPGTTPIQIGGTPGHLI